MNIERVSLLVMGFAALFTVNPAFAQSLERAAPFLEEIVVTAKAREEKLQDVPLAISVLTERDLDVRGISDVQDLADYTPNLEITSPSGRRDAVLSVRGLGTGTTDEKYQPVGFFVDGIWMGGQIVGLSTADVERIEIIKGPHSTFGRATYGASIDYVTKTPSLEEFSGSIRAQLSDMVTGVDSNHEITATVSGPIVEGKVSGSLFVQRRFDSGIAPAIGDGPSEVGEEITQMVSGVLYTEFNKNTSLKLRGLYTTDDDTFISGMESRPQHWVQQGANVVADAATGRFWISGEVPDPIRENYYSGDPDPFGAVGEHESLGRDQLERDKVFLSAIFEHNFDNEFVFRYSGSYMDQEENAFFDGISSTLNGIDPVLGPAAGLPTAFDGFANIIREEWEEVSHTFRVLSPEDERLTWSLGAHWYDSENANFSPRTDQTALPGNEEKLNRVEEITTLAAFGALGYQITDQFRLSIEGRWQEEEVGRQAVPNALSSIQRLGTDISEKESAFLPRVTLSFEPNDDHHFYVLYAEGRKSGRYNLVRTGGNAFDTLPDGTFPPEAFAYVEPEEMKNYELGLKSTFLDGRARSNVAVFFQDITDQQFVNSDVDPESLTGFSTRLANVGESEIFGFEADATFAVTDRLVLQGAVGYADQEFKSDVQPQVGSDLHIFQLAGDPVGEETLLGKTYSNIPEWSGNLSGTYTVPTSFMGSEEWSVRTDLLYKGKRFVEGANLAYIPASTRVNLRTSLSGQNWTLSLFADNLFDDKTANRGNSFVCGLNAVTDPAVAATLGLAAPPAGGGTALAGGQRCLYLIPSRSREIGVSFQLDF